VHAGASARGKRVAARGKPEVRFVTPTWFKAAAVLVCGLSSYSFYRAFGVASPSVSAVASRTSATPAISDIPEPRTASLPAATPVPARADRTTPEAIVIDVPTELAEQLTESSDVRRAEAVAKIDDMTQELRSDSGKAIVLVSACSDSTTTAARAAVAASLRGRLTTGAGSDSARIRRASARIVRVSVGRCAADTTDGRPPEGGKPKP
jgi:hypothetical protein